MNFFLDENFPKKASDLLKKYNYTVFDIRGSNQEGINDIDIFNLSQSKESIFLTTDKDFYHTIHLTNKPHFSIVVIAAIRHHT